MVNKYKGMIYLLHKGYVDFFHETFRITMPGEETLKIDYGDKKDRIVYRITVDGEPNVTVPVTYFNKVLPYVWVTKENPITIKITNTCKNTKKIYGTVFGEKILDREEVEKVLPEKTTDKPLKIKINPSPYKEEEKEEKSLWNKIKQWTKNTITTSFFG